MELSPKRRKAQDLMDHAMTLFIKGVKHYGNIINIEMFYAKDTDHARAIMVANHGKDWFNTHVLTGFETFHITR